jgi:hypothetical protein
MITTWGEFDQIFVRKYVIFMKNYVINLCARIALLASILSNNWHLLTSLAKKSVFEKMFLIKNPTYVLRN